MTAPNTGVASGSVTVKVPAARIEAGSIGSLKLMVISWLVPIPCPPHPIVAGLVEITTGGTAVAVAVGVGVAVEVSEAVAVVVGVSVAVSVAVTVAV